MHPFLNNILHVFFGTPRRATWTLGISAAIYFGLNPNQLVRIIRSILHNIIVPVIRETVIALVGAVGPLLGPIFAIILVVLAFRLILGRGKH